MNQYRYREERDNAYLEKAIIVEGQIKGWEQDVVIPIHRNKLQDDVDSLKAWERDQEKTVPDNVIKGIAEIENFLSGNSDSETLAAMIRNLADSLTDLISTKYKKPDGGIPKDDLSQQVRQSLDKADTALQDHQDLSGLENGIESNKELAITIADIMLMALTYGCDDPVETTNPEFSLVLTDADGKIILAKYVEGGYQIMGEKYEL